VKLKRTRDGSFSEKSNVVPIGMRLCRRARLASAFPSRQVECVWRSDSIVGAVARLLPVDGAFPAQNSGETGAAVKTNAAPSRLDPPGRPGAPTSALVPLLASATE
jgi:hypothetical protein